MTRRIRKEPIVIEVRGGVVQGVQNIPPGHLYEVKDYDDLDANDADTSMAQAAKRRRAALPPDPDGINDERSGWAGRAVAEFQRATGTDDEDALSDLLADLMHWADRNNYEFDAALERGRYHYAAETVGEEA